MINVIKKEVFDETPAATISNTDIEALVVQDSIILLEPVKQSIEITYDALGHADKNFVHLGTQYDHRVTWLHFNLDQLIWNFNKNYDYDEETKYNHYTFKIAFTKVDDNADDITTIWEFNGVDFEIPRGITKEAGLYRIVLIIEEYQKTPEISNIKIDEPEYIERFVTAEIRGKVYSSVYNPALDITAEIVETDQTAALVKTKIECTLTDDGIFTSDSVELGQQYDNFIRYFKFNPRRITAHLNDFHMFAIFKQNDLFYYSLFETTKADDPLDDYSASYPVIAWIPSGVYQSAGVWEVAIIAFAGNIDDINRNDDNGDYYFYVSQVNKMKVASNHLTKDIVTQKPILSITTNLVTNLGEVIITKDDDIYQTVK